jgi:SHS2 domain-containing protein
MSRVETFDHTADLGLRVRANDVVDLFRAAAEGLFGIIVANPDSIQAREMEQIAISADDAEDLLVAWLSELLFLCETKHQLFRDFDLSITEDQKSLMATIAGEPIDPHRHILDHEVKAVTRHGLSVRRDGPGWVAEVILDI